MKELFRVPDFPDPEQQRHAKILVVTQFAAIIMALLIVVFTVIFTTGHPEVIYYGIVGMVAIVSSFVLLKMGKIKASGWIIVILGWAILTLDLALISGIRGVNVLGQVLIVMFAGLAISGRAAMIIIVVNLAANFLILNLEQNGILTPTPLPANFTRWFIQTIYTGLAATYIWRVDTLIKNALNKSQNTADQYRALFERTSDGVVIMDLDWKIISTNEQALRMLGFSEKEFVGLNTNQWKNYEDSELTKERQSQILKGDNLPTFEESLIKKDGTKITVEMSQTLVYDTNLNPQHIQCILRDITVRKMYERELKQQALFDPLTNLPNRILFENQYQILSSSQADDKGLVAVLFVDLDDFKLVNDTYGHGAGDRVLQIVGARLQASIRDSDTVARIGGDEFIIILDNMNHKDDVRKVAQKIRRNIAEPMNLEEHKINITASIGINIAEKTKLSKNDLVKTSDTAMYQVKEDGKNDFRFYDPESSS